MKVCPYISQTDRPSVPGPRLWLYALRSAFVQTPIADTDSRRVDLASWPERIDHDGVVHFRDNGRAEYGRMSRQVIKPDVVVLCTGYKQTFPFLTALCGRDAVSPDETPDRVSGLDTRGIWNRNEPQLGFIGFVRPSLGAIPPLAEMQAQLWVLQLLAPESLPRTLKPEDEPHYRLHPPPGSRITYGVDHESYAYQLALDMDSAPGLTDILKITWSKPDIRWWRLPIIWAVGANLNTKYRLQGPWRHPEAGKLLTSSEFWETITRRPILFGKLPHQAERPFAPADSHRPHFSVAPADVHIRPVELLGLPGRDHKRYSAAPRLAWIENESGGGGVQPAGWVVWCHV